MIQKKTVVLNRVSSNKQDFESQNNAIKEYIEKENIVVDEWITEEGISGYSNKLNDREAINKIEEMALLEQLGTLIVFNLDRIGRTTQGTEFMKNMTYSNVKVISVTEGVLNPGDDTDELITGIKFWNAQQESKKISLRSKNGKEAANKKGLFCGGPVNFGYGVVNQKMFVIPEEAEIVKLIFELYIKYSKNETVKYLQQKNITKRGRKFSQHMVHDILKDTVYIGLKRYNQWQKVSTDPTNKKRRFDKEALRFQDYKEELRILDDKTFYKAQELINKRTSSKDKVKYTNRTNALFEGLLWHRCGDGEVRKLHLDNKKDKYGNIIYSYRCSHCRRNFYKNVRKTYGSKKYNELLENSVLQLIDNMAISELENKVREKQCKKNDNIRISLESSTKELNKKLTGLKNMEKELLDIFSGESRMDKNILVGMMAKTKADIELLDKKVKQLQKEYTEVNENISIDKSLIEHYKNFNTAYELADIKQKKLLLQQVVEKITFDGDEIKITLYLE